MCVLNVQNVGGKMGTSTSNTLKLRYAVRLQYFNEGSNWEKCINRGPSW